LVEAETGNHVWAERYDRDLADIFVVQDEITEAVTIAVAPAIRDAELRRAVRKPAANLDAWAAYQRGLWHLYKLTANDNILAQQFFERAIDIEPTFASGYKGLALAYGQAVVDLRVGAPNEAYSSAESLARRAIALDPADAEAHATLARAILVSRGDYEGALAEARRALALNPNLAIAHTVLAQTLIFSGQPRQGVAAFERAVRLDPRYRMAPGGANLFVIGLYFSREYESAAEAANRAVRADPEYPLLYRWLAAALGQLGRTAEATEALERAIEVAPASFDVYVRQRVPWHRPEDHAHMLEGLRKAGWSE
jgi:adenylate cyclase